MTRQWHGLRVKMMRLGRARASRGCKSYWLLALALMLACALGEPGPAAAQAEFSVKAAQAILMDADTGAIMYQRNADELMYPASMSKLMTLTVVFKALKAGELKLSDEFLMSENAWRKGGAPSGTSAMFVPLGTRATVEELIKGITVQSGNDAAISIAENMAGAEDLFAARMTEQARALGLNKSVFKNATGLYQPDHVTTARELALLARHIIQDYPDYYGYFALKEFPYRKHKFTNRNPLINLVAGIDGLKTGFIKESGYGIVASAKQEGRRLIAVLNGCSTAEERRDEGRRLLEWGFKNFSEVKLFDAGEVIGHARVWGGERMFVPLTGNGDVNIWLARQPANPKLRAQIIYNGPLKPPLRKGEQVARLRVTTPSETTNEVPLYVAEDIGRAGVMRRGLDTLLYLATRWIP
ncbi:MAG TPA: D-alanyl-D-alanine carboxypeptidase family protein [Hyphomicrobiaceae bacterium]|nr:D-alanyl-D-alanine carboxypeptidase family protein [Hyphomicrobiaceae bacterium]